MQRMKQLLATILALALLLPGTLALSAEITEDASAEMDISLLQPFDDNGDVLIAIDEEGNEEYVLSENNSIEDAADILEKAEFSAPTASGSFYAQLNAAGKACYNKIAQTSFRTILNSPKKTLNNIVYHTVEFPVNGITGIRMTGKISNGAFYPDEAGKKIRSRVRTDIATAWLTASYDFPEYLWLRSIIYNYKISAVRGSSNTVEITNISIGFHLEFNGQEEKMLADMRKAVDRFIAERIDPKADRYTKLLTAHNFLLDGNVYSTAQDHSLSHTPYSALIFGDAYQPVCDGYSGAFKMICDKLNISNTVAISTKNTPGHMWNNIQMDDGKWYNADLTWDDTGSNPLAYFLVGSNTIIDGRKFNEDADHTEANIFSVLNGKDLVPSSFTYPRKNSEAYVYIGSAKFPDVGEDAWYHDSVMTASKNKLFYGDNAGYFRPSKTITRAELVTVLANLKGVTPDRNRPSPFKDVNKDNWFAGAVIWANDQGLVYGGSNGYFRPNDPISREELCTILARMDNVSLDSVSPMTLFADDRLISSWAYKSVYYCQDKGLITGNNGKFQPTGKTTRAEAATVLVRYLNTMH